jgi:hypothetical protein
MRSEHFSAMFDGWNEELEEAEVSDREDDDDDALDQDASDNESEVGGEIAEEEYGLDWARATLDRGEGSSQSTCVPATTGDAPETNTTEGASPPRHDSTGMEAQISRQSSTSSVSEAVTPFTSPVKQSRQSTTTSTAASPTTGKRRTPRAPASVHKAKVVITDASYKTFKALLHYLYTDTVVFAPLTSTFLAAREAAQQKKLPFPYANKKEWFVGSNPANLPAGVEALVRADSNRILMTSAKEMYTIADKLCLPELKLRAGSHIFRSLTVATIPLEVFSPFTTVRWTLSLRALLTRAAEIPRDAGVPEGLPPAQLEGGPALGGHEAGFRGDRGAGQLGPLPWLCRGVDEHASAARGRCWREQGGRGLGRGVGGAGQFSLDRCITCTCKL